jgi:signal peptidase I
MQKRGVLARVGVTLLNLLAPGVGLLRIGKWKLATAIYAVALLFLIFMNAGPAVGFGLFATAAALGLSTYPVSILGTWLMSSRIVAPRPWYADWYVIACAVLLSWAASYFLGDLERVKYRSFYTPAEGMAPTLPPGDRFFAYMRSPRNLRRGDLLMVRTSDGAIYIKRLAALPGDRIAMANGVVVLNGLPVSRRLVATEMLGSNSGTEVVRKQSEQFPGELTAHLVYDTGMSTFDTMAEQRVRPGHLFVLGDNRDHSADSRVPRAAFGLEQVPIADIKGWPLFHSFGSSRPMGTSINRKDMQ